MASGNAETGIDRKYLRDRWWFDKGWIYEWRHVVTSYHALLTCCVCGTARAFSVGPEKAITSSEAGRRIDAAVKEAGWRKGLIRAWCPTHR